MTHVDKVEQTPLVIIYSTALKNRLRITELVLDEFLVELLSYQRFLVLGHRWLILPSMLAFTGVNYESRKRSTAYKVSVFTEVLVPIHQHSNWIRRFNLLIFLISSITVKIWIKKLRMGTLCSQWVSWH